MQQKHAALRGSYTVEAAVILPLIVLILATILLTSFYLHDRAVLQASVCEIASVGANALPDSNGRAQMREQKSRIHAGRLLGGRNLSGNLQVSEESAEASWTASYPFPGIVRRLLGKTREQISVTWKQERILAVKTIRLVRGGKDVLGGTD